MLSVLFAAAAIAHNPHDPVHAIDISPTFGADGILLAARIPAQSYRQNELARSDDGGLTWTDRPIGVDNKTDMAEVRLSPAFEADGLAIATSDDGVYVSTDGAATFSRALAGESLGEAEIVANEGGTPVIAVAGAQGLLWCSRDLGASFEDCTPPGSLALIGLSSSEDGSRLAAIGYTGVWLSRDRGLSWTPTSTIGIVPDTVAVAPGLLLVGTEQGLLRSTDEGATFREVTGLPKEGVYAVAITPEWPVGQLVIAATETTAAWVSADGGITFVEHPVDTKLSDQSDRHFFQFRFARDFATSGCVELGAFEGLFQSCDRGVTWIEHDIRPPPLVTSIAVSPAFPTDGTVLVSTYMGGVYASTDRGDSFTNFDAHLVSGGVYDAKLVDDGAAGLEQIVVQENNFLSAPFGTPWVREDLGDLGDGIFPTELALDPAWATSGIALMGTRFTGMARTDDHGATFAPVAGDGQWVSSATLGAGGAGWFGTTTGKLYATADFGLTWTDVSAELDASDARVFVRVEPGGRVWCGTAGGLRVSDDGGASFHLADGPPEVASGVIDQVAVAPDGTVFASVRGSGTFRGSATSPFSAIPVDLDAQHIQIEEYEFSPDFASDGTMFASGDEALLRSEDRGDTWVRIDPRPIRYDQQSQAVTTVGWSPALLEVGNGEDSVSALYQMSGPETQVSVVFDGDRVDLVGRHLPGGGRADLWLDNTLVATISADGPEDHDVVLWTSDVLPMGPHALAVEWLDGGPFDVDAFDVGSPVAPLASSGTETGPDTGASTGGSGLPPGYDGDPPGGEAPRGDESRGGCGCDGAGGPSGWWASGVAVLAALGRRRRRTW